MSELVEQPMGAERESGLIKRFTSRIGNFLSETYTYKGAIQKERTEKFGKIYSQFTGDTREAMMKDYEKVATNNARWKVIRNWAVTGGAGLALWYGIAHVGAAGVFKFVTDTAPKAIVGGAKDVFNWIFNPFTLQVNLPGPHTGFTLPMYVPQGPGIPIPTGINIK